MKLDTSVERRRRERERERGGQECKSPLEVEEGEGSVRLMVKFLASKTNSEVFQDALLI